MAVVFAHPNPVRLADGRLTVDRKFHDGMLAYAASLRVPVTSLNPGGGVEASIMDPVTLVADSLPYRVVALAVDRHGTPSEASRATVEREVAASRLVVGFGTAHGAAAEAARQGRRFVLMLEYDLATQVTVARSFARSRLREAWAALRCLQGYHRSLVPVMRQAHEIHCNGYPVHEECARHNPRRLLYLDSRMGRDLAIAPPALEQRLTERRTRPLRLIFSGRYERMKGALDAVETARELLAQGLDVEMDTYGQGSLAGDMARVAATSGGRIRVHAAIAFPELVRRSREADVFVCCHIQSDPSCTYLESMGAGLPIAGYRNRMWTAMAGASDAGRIAPRNTPAALARVLADLAAAPDELDRLSRNARRFAIEHAFEREFERRTAALLAALRPDAPGDAGRRPAPEPAPSAVMTGD